MDKSIITIIVIFVAAAAVVALGLWIIQNQPTLIQGVFDWIRGKLSI